MTKIKLGKALTEVSEILNALPEELTEKVPESFLEFVDSNKDESYDFHVVGSLEDTKFLNDTEVILGMLYENYWAGEDEKKELLKKDSEELLLKKEAVSEIKPKDNIFDIKAEELKVADVADEEIINKLIPKEETLFTKVINWLKKYFKE